MSAHGRSEALTPQRAARRLNSYSAGRACVRDRWRVARVPRRRGRQ
jgi:hypothetical protein